MDPFIIEAFSPLQVLVIPEPQPEEQPPSQEPKPDHPGGNVNPSNVDPKGELDSTQSQVGPHTKPPQVTGQSEIEATIRFENPKETNGPSSSNQPPASPPRGRCYAQPIPIPGAKDPDKEEVWHTTDKHLDWRHLYKFD